MGIVKALRYLKPTHWVYLLVHLVLVVVGYVFTQASESTLRPAIGASLIAAGVTGWVVFIYVFLTESTKRQLNLLTQFGLIGAFSSRGASIKSEYDERLAKVRHRIDVMGFGQRALREDYSQDFSRWKRNAVIRILLLDPEYPGPDLNYAAQRDSEEGSPAGTIAGEVRQFVSEVARLLDDNFQIRLYRCLPAVNIFRVDDELFWGPYLIKRVSRNSPTFLVARGGVMFDTFTAQFEEVWKDDALSRPVPEEWITKSN